MTLVAAEVGWKTILMKDAYEALYCQLPELEDCRLARLHSSAVVLAPLAHWGTGNTPYLGRDSDLMLWLITAVYGVTPFAHIRAEEVGVQCRCQESSFAQKAKERFVFGVTRLSGTRTAKGFRARQA